MNASRLRHVRALGIAVACSWMIAASAGEAAAADPAPAVAGTSSEADRLFEQGVAAQKAGKLADAEALFVKAWGIKKTWDIAANLGLVELKQGKLAEGARHVAYAIANLPPTESDTTRDNLAKAFAAARAEVAEVKVTCDVEGATVRVGGKVAGVTPLGTAVFAAPGSVSVDVTKDGYEAASKSVEATKGGTAEIALTLVKKSSGDTERSKVPGFVIGGVGVAGLITGGVLIGAGYATNSDVNAKLPHDDKGNPLCQRPPVTGPDRPECAALRARTSDANTLANAGVITLAAGGLAVAGAVLYFVWPSSSTTQKAGARVTPVLGRQGGGVVLSGSF